MSDPTSRIEAQRWRLVDEIHDALAHGMANAALQAMAHQPSNDPTELQQVLLDIGALLNTTLADLRLLERVHRQDPRAPHVDRVAELSRPLAPTAVAADWEARLRRAGAQARVTVGDGSDRLRPTVRRSVNLAIEGAARVTLARAGPGDRVTMTVTVEPTDVVVAVRHRPRGSVDPPDPEGLQSLRDRVDLVEGVLTESLSAGLHPVWSVAVRLPHL